MRFAGKTVVLCVTGGIAAYKAADLTSKLHQNGAEVRVLMTESAAQFISPMTFETLSGNRAVVDTFDRSFPWEVEHISLAKAADVFVIAPATANVIAKAAHGIADDMVTTTLLATKAPVNEKLDEGFDVILEIEVQGAMQIKKKRPDAVMVFIAPPSFEELASRLRGRGTEDEAKVQKRLETAKGELEQKDKFDYVVVNDTVDRAVDEIKGILASRR